MVQTMERLGRWVFDWIRTDAPEAFRQLISQSDNLNQWYAHGSRYFDAGQALLSIAARTCRFRKSAFLYLSPKLLKTQLFIRRTLPSWLSFAADKGCVDKSRSVPQLSRRLAPQNLCRSTSRASGSGSKCVMGRARKAHPVLRCRLETTIR